TPAKCFFQFSLPNCSIHKSLKTLALDKVSLVEKLLDTTTNKVSSKEISCSNCSICWASILLIKCNCKSEVLYGFKALYAIRNPKSLPPILILTTERLDFPLLVYLSTDNISLTKFLM